MEKNERHNISLTHTHYDTHTTQKRGRGCCGFWYVVGIDENGVGQSGAVPTQDGAARCSEELLVEKPHIGLILYTCFVYKKD